MNKDKFLKILSIIEKQEQEHKKLQDELDTFMDVLCPSSYPPIIDVSWTTPCLDILKVLSEDIEDWVAYYIYEVSNMDSAVVTNKDSKEYEFKDRKQFIQFMLDEWYIKEEK